MLITPKEARDVLADLTQACAIPVDPAELTHASYGRFATHGHLLIGDVPVRGYKHKGRWWFDDREIRQVGRVLADLEFDPGDLVDAKLPQSSLEGVGWRSTVRNWMGSAAFREVRDHGCPCGDRCNRRELQEGGLPCGLTMTRFLERCSSMLIASTRPLAVMSWSDSQKKWMVPRAYASLLDRYEKVEEQLIKKAQRCSDCGKSGDAWSWRTPGVSGWITRCPSCTESSFQKYIGQLRGTKYDSVRRTIRADDYLCQVCPEPRRASSWDHCHDHGYVRGPLCARCNAHEGNGLDFLFSKAGLAHLLACIDCQEQRTLPYRHHETAVARELWASERHGRCTRRPQATLTACGLAGGLRFELICTGHSQQTHWVRELSGSEVKELVRSLIDDALRTAAS